MLLLQVEDFEKVGVDHIWAVAIGSPETVEDWSRKTKLKEGRVRSWLWSAPDCIRQGSTHSVILADTRGG